jgi:outer membrane lipoprotein carrier protein
MGVAILAAGIVMPHLSPARAGNPPTLAQVLAAHCRAREELTTLRARFVQTKVFELLEEEDESAGMLYYQKPDAVRWQYTKPDSSYTILRGDSGWAVFPDIRQVQRFGLHGSRAANVLAIVGFGSCGPDLESSFQISLASGEHGAPILVLVPTVAEIAASFDRIELTLDPKLYLPRKVSMHETSGDTVRFEFLDLEPGVPVDSALFEHTIPKGYEVVG